VLLGFLVFLVYSRVFAVAAQRFGIPSPLQPLVAIAFVWVWWRQKGSATAAAATRTFMLAIGVFVLATLPGLLQPHPSPTIGMLSIIGQDTLFVAALVYVTVARHSIASAAWGMIAALALLSATTIASTLDIDIADGFWGLARTSEQLISDVDEGERAIGPYDDPNFFGQALVILLAPAFERSRRAPSRRGRVVAGATVLAGLAAIASTYSRGAMIGTALLIAYQLWRDPPPLRRFAPAFVAGVVALAVIAPGSVIGRLSSVSDAWPGNAADATDVSIRGRASEAIAAISMFRDEPLTGVGYGAYDERYLEFGSTIGLDPRRDERAAHNQYLEIAGETGMIGLAAAAVTAAIIWRSTRRRVVDRWGDRDLRTIATGFRGSVIGFAVTAAFLHDVHPRPWMLCLGLAVAAGAAAPTPRGPAGATG